MNRLIQSGRFTSPRLTLQKSYVFCTTLQFYFVFYTTFSFSLFSLVLKHCAKYIESLQHCKLSIQFLPCCNILKKKCNVAHIVCILCNVLRTGRMETMKRLYKIHSKIATLYKISASADGGPRSRVRARGTLRSAPHRH